MSKKFDVTEKIYVQVAEELKSLIVKGKVKFGERLPSEEQLSSQYVVSRGTIRKAIQLLADENLVKKVQGKGTYAVESQSGYPFGQMLISYTETLRNRGITFTTRIIESRIEEPSATIKARLKIGSEKVFYIERLRLVEGKPAGLFKNWVVLKLVPNIDSKDFTRLGLFEAIEEDGKQKIKLGVREFSAVIPDTEQMQLLGLEHNEALLKLEQVTYNQNDEIIECSDVFLITKRYKVSSLLTR